MKIKSHSKLYFAAYPLKAILQSSAPEEKKSPVLKLLLSNKTKTFSRFRVTPMLNPYKNEDIKAGQDLIRKNE
ncbi:MAG: hypothetical protein IT214_07520 [Chitinophagaceae bacterium]|jgi:hypothetical protein|nr:hypothetical protein [Chitinophagaceae bacterium]OQY96341.1 MAG: hypothetical protein B6D37_02285 [Sphingobacteriales bacterium UTBCD1]